ncbi:MAG TPA: hypothetical protein VK989_13275 [Polyangia bacterium]|jgi:hypothetical protein|nr:hypothetical protein [Polyangia bacterium]
MLDERPKFRLIRGPATGPTCCVGDVCNPSTCVTLPEPYRCGDCLWLSICHAVGHARASQRECVFFPSKFVRDEEAATR